MRLRYILTIILFGSLISGTAAVIILNMMSPLNSILIPMLFLVCLGLSVSGFVTSLLLSTRALKKNAWHIRTNITTSIRQGLIIGTMIVFLLIISHFELLTIPVTGLVIAIFALIEYLTLPKEIRN